MPGTAEAVKRALIGRPRASRDVQQQLLPHWMALPVFAADPLSSLAYASQAVMLALAVAGSSALALLTPVSAGVALLLVVVMATTRQTVRVYAHGGGAYRVARNNLGDRAGLVAAAAQLVDVVATVAVATAAAAAALGSVWPELADAPVLVALVLLAVVAVANLRGVREIGALLAAPVWLFVAALVVLLAVGALRCGLGVGGCPTAGAAGEASLAAGGAGALSAAVVLRAVVAGSVMVTGLQRLISGVGAFRYPQAAGATATLAVTGVVAVAGFVGVGALALATGADAGATAGGQGGAAGHPTVLAQVTAAVLGDGLAPVVIQLAAAAVLVLAANAALADFPRVASVLAADGWLPRRMAARGDRMGFSAGLLAVTVAAALALLVAGADVAALIPLYVVAVFTALTCSQAGMARYWWQRELRDRRWRGGLAALGALATAAVLAVALVVEAVGGTWIVVAALVVLMAAMTAVRRHDRDVAARLDGTAAEVADPRAHDALLIVDRIDEPAARALSWVLGTNPRSVTALGVPIPGADLAQRWSQLSGGLPLTMVADAAERGASDKLVAAVAAQRSPDRTTTVVLAEELARSWGDQLRRHRLDLRLKAHLRRLEGVAVTDLTSPSGGPGPYTVEEPAEHHVLVLASGVHAGVDAALAYARLLQPTSLRALSVGIDPNTSARLLADWEDRALSVPLEVVGSPFRSLAEGVRRTVRRFAPDGRHTVVTCVLPELIGLPRRTRWLHGQSAETVRSALLFERGVITIALPYRLPPPDDAPAPGG